MGRQRQRSRYRGCGTAEPEVPAARRILFQHRLLQLSREGRRPQKYYPEPSRRRETVHQPSDSCKAKKGKIGLEEATLARSKVSETYKQKRSRVFALFFEDLRKVRRGLERVQGSRAATGRVSYIQTIRPYFLFHRFRASCRSTCVFRALYKSVT
jgi:hypothetical protein